MKQQVKTESWSMQHSVELTRYCTKFSFKFKTEQDIVDCANSAIRHTCSKSICTGINANVTAVDDNEQQNVKIGLEFWEAEFAIYLG